VVSQLPGLRVFWHLFQVLPALTNRRGRIEAGLGASTHRRSTGSRGAEPSIETSNAHTSRTAARSIEPSIDRPNTKTCITTSLQLMLFVDGFTIRCKESDFHQAQYGIAIPIGPFIRLSMT
jgi:hypothetical protein